MADEKQILPPPGLSKWKTFCWYVAEFNKVFSNQPSFYSGKRIKEWIAFATGEYILLHGFVYLLIHDKLDYAAVCFVAAVAFGVAGYQLNQIQKEKKGEEKKGE
jgi:threonine dehydrogenase-like Zn-dependent dehydrogenase